MLHDRIVLVKTGFATGSSFGGRVTTIPLADISAIQVNKGMITGSIEVVAAGYGAHKASDFWSVGDKDDPWKRPNCLPADKKLLKEFEPYLAELRTMVSRARTQPPPWTQFSPPSIAAQPPPQHQTDPAAQPECLARLRAEGVLSDSEFGAAKECSEDEEPQRHHPRVVLAVDEVPQTGLSAGLHPGATVFAVEREVALTNGGYHLWSGIHEVVVVDVASVVQCLPVAAFNPFECPVGAVLYFQADSEMAVKDDWRELGKKESEVVQCVADDGIISRVSRQPADRINRVVGRTSRPVVGKGTCQRQ